MSGGVRTALETVLEGQDEDVAAEALAQTGLFDDLDEAETGRLDAPSPLSAALTPPPRRQGRTKGSKNRRTEAVVAWLLTQHRHPLSVMMEAYSMSPAELAGCLGLQGDAVDLLDIFKLQMRMAEAVAPYIAQRLPQAVQIDARAGISIAFEGVSLPARAQAGPAIEGELAVRLPQLSDAESRTDD